MVQPMPIEVDRQVVGLLKSNHALHVSVAPGRHVLNTAGIFIPEAVTTIDAKAGNNYFYKVSVPLNLKLDGNFSRMTLMSDTEGRNKIARAQGFVPGSESKIASQAEQRSNNATTNAIMLNWQINQAAY